MFKPDVNEIKRIHAKYSRHTIITPFDMAYLFQCLDNQHDHIIDLELELDQLDPPVPVSTLNHGETIV